MKYHTKDKEIQSVLSSDIDARVRYFTHKVAEWEALWLMENENGFFTDEDKDGREVLVLWPFKEFALCALADNLEFQKQLLEVSIYDSMEKYLPYIAEHGIYLLVFLGKKMDGALLDAENFRNMMEGELARYGDPDTVRF